MNMQYPQYFLKKIIKIRLHHALVMISIINITYIRCYQAKFNPPNKNLLE